MKAYRFQASINRPPSEVFPFLVETEKQALYSDVPMRLITEGAMHTGSKMEVTMGSGLMKANLGLEMTDVTQDRKMAYKSFSGPIDWQGEYLLEPTPDGGTTVTHEGSMRFHGLWRLAEPLVGAELSRNGAKEMDRMKAAIEGVPAENS
jgi:hypothetical protein